MKIAFLTEMNFSGKIPDNHPNMRTEFAWMKALDATHFPITKYEDVSGHDLVCIIWPKGLANTNSEGISIDKIDKNDTFRKVSVLPILETLKKFNKKIAYVQEGPVWFSNDYELDMQFTHHNIITESDVIFCHNEFDKKWYRGLFNNKKIIVLPTLMITKNIENLKWAPTNKVIIGGNFCRWYGGFQSYLISDMFDNCEKWTITSHAKRNGEDQIDNLHHAQRMMWNDWMKFLSEFKYAIHLMPTVAAGTFSLNCAYFGIPCIGNEKVDTQRICFPELSVDVENLSLAREKASILSVDIDFYNECSYNARKNLENFSIENFLKHFNRHMTTI